MEGWRSIKWRPFGRFNAEYKLHDTGRMVDGCHVRHTNSGILLNFDIKTTLITINLSVMSYESINLFVSDTAEYISINQNFRYM